MIDALSIIQVDKYSKVESGPQEDEESVQRT